MTRIGASGASGAARRWTPAGRARAPGAAAPRVATPRVAVALVALAAAGTAGAQEAARPPLLVVDDLTGDDWRLRRQAEHEAGRLGARVLPALLAARAAAPARAERREPLDRALRAVVDALAAEATAPLGEPPTRTAADAALGGVAGAVDRDRPDASMEPLDPAEAGDVGAVGARTPRDWASLRARARRARGALLAAGPAVTGQLLRTPPLRGALQEAALARVAEAIYLRERARLLGPGAPEAGPAPAPPGEAALAAFVAGYRGLADLCAPVVGLGLRDPDAVVRGAYRRVRDEALDGALGALDDVDPAVRRAAEDALLALGPLAQQPLAQRAKDGATPHARATAARLARWTRLGLSRALVARLAHDLEGYEDLPYRARRARVLELERLGGVEAVPTLRALLRDEPSLDVRTVAAIALFRLQDPVGAQWLALHRGSIPLAAVSDRELAAIHMDQGLHYLQLARFERAEAEFKRVLDLEPTNEVAWYNLACTYSRWGRIDQAFEHLERAIEHGFDDAGHMDKDPDLDPLRRDPRYEALVRRLREGAPPADDAAPPPRRPER